MVTYSKYTRHDYEVPEILRINTDYYCHYYPEQETWRVIDWTTHTLTSEPFCISRALEKTPEAIVAIDEDGWRDQILRFADELKFSKGQPYNQAIR